MSPESTAAAVAESVQRLGGAFMLDPATRESGIAHGFSAWSFYYAGRLGVLGAVDADVALAAAYFLPPGRGREAWEKGLRVLPPDAAARRFAQACRAWGRAHLAGFDAAARLTELATRAAAGAPVAGLPLFAGWRALTRETADAASDDPAGALALALHVLREHRGAVHGLAVIATGLTPLEAIVSGPYGEGHATFFGWPEPFPAAAGLAERRAAAEELTTRLDAAAYAGLPEAERVEFLALLEAASAAAFSG